MKRCLNLGISLCLIGLLSGCCCGQRCGFFRGGGCYSPCSPCGQPFGFAPFNGGCNSCGTGGYIGGPGVGAPGVPYGAVPSTYLDPYYGTAAVSADGTAMQTTGLPPADGTPMAAYGQPVIDQTSFNQPTLGQPAPFSQSPVTTALMKPESLSTY